MVHFQIRSVPYFHKFSSKMVHFRIRSVPQFHQFPSEMVHFQKRNLPRFHQFSSTICPFQIRSLGGRVGPGRAGSAVCLTSSENSELKIELRVGEEKLQLALPTSGRTWPASGIGGIAPRASLTWPAPSLARSYSHIKWHSFRTLCAQGSSVMLRCWRWFCELILLFGRPMPCHGHLPIRCADHFRLSNKSARSQMLLAPRNIPEPGTM